ncbi:MAG: hypothetical protein KJ967_00610 [Elusimicrobia bacterium]|nr:hypothetical protein [Elusimicrobiota bacterium]
MDTYVCGRCGFVAFGQAPDICPVCGAPKSAFSLDNSAVKKPSDPENLSELEKKHIPVVNLVKKCGLVGPGCVDANIRIGEILHPSEAKHFITYIDVYLDRKFIARVHLTPENLNPAAGIHLRASSGKLLAMENCNLHGRWMTEVTI